MHRFFAEPSLLQSSIIMLPESIAHQVRDVLRLHPGEQFILLDNSGEEALVALEASTRAGVTARLIERRPGKAEPSVRITLCQGMLKSARFEWILEKGTELGVTTFAPILCRRSTAGLEEAGAAKIKRWQRIIQEAAEQCGRSRLPALQPARAFVQALDAIPPGVLAVIPWEEERTRSLRDVVSSLRASAPRIDPRGRDESRPHDIFIFIGPEGGFTVEEIDLARRRGAQPVTLGPRILRAETAALVAVASIVYELEK